MTLQEWVKQEGGINKCAEKHGFRPSTLGGWCRLLRYPTHEHEDDLIKVSNGRVDLPALRSAYIEAKAQAKIQQPARSRRLRGDVLVYDLDRLKLIFEEMELPPHRCNLHGPRLLRRWAITKVTVQEVRSAVLELETQGRDGGNVEEIHKAIGAARSASLRSQSE